jgi:hypothetical protein
MIPVESERYDVGVGAVDAAGHRGNFQPIQSDQNRILW